MNSITLRVSHISLLVTITLFSSCQKDLKLDYGSVEIKQVIIGNLHPNSRLEVNISRSKHPDDYDPIDFLQDCKVDLYEDGIFKETMPFFLKDTLSGLGFYRSTFNLLPNKTYKIISTHTELGVAEAEEYVPTPPSVIYYNLQQHADSLHPVKTGTYGLLFQDSTNWKNYYYIATLYRILRPVVSSSGDTTYKYDYINTPSHFQEAPNTSNYFLSLFNDLSFDGQFKSLIVDFPSQYNKNYKEILLIIEFSNCGKNFYDWNLQLLPLQTAFNEGQLERVNLKGNIINGYGRFTSNSSTFIGIPIK